MYQGRLQLCHAVTDNEPTHDIPLFAAAAVAMSTGLSAAHGGGLDAEGCHNNRKTGDLNRTGFRGGLLA